MTNIKIYTDGACSGNPGPGGWAAIFLIEDKECEISGGDTSTTNNRMELTSVVEALESLEDPANIEIYTDSKYVQKGASEWITNWKKNNWLTSTKDPVKNSDLWKKLDIASTKHSIIWKWVKGHNGNEFNERADILAKSEVQKRR